jgi:hypothetical protein
MVAVQAFPVHFSTPRNYAKCVTSKRAAGPSEMTDELRAKHLIGRCEKLVATFHGLLCCRSPGLRGAASRGADAAGGTRGKRVRRRAEGVRARGARRALHAEIVGVSSGLADAQGTATDDPAGQPGAATLLAKAMGLDFRHTQGYPGRSAFGELVSRRSYRGLATAGIRF